MARVVSYGVERGERVAATADHRVGPEFERRQVEQLLEQRPLRQVRGQEEGRQALRVLQMGPRARLDQESSPAGLPVDHQQVEASVAVGVALIRVGAVREQSLEAGAIPEAHAPGERRRAQVDGQVARAAKLVIRLVIGRRLLLWLVAVDPRRQQQVGVALDRGPVGLAVAPEDAGRAAAGCWRADSSPLLHGARSLIREEQFPQLAPAGQRVTCALLARACRRSTAVGTSEERARYLLVPDERCELEFAADTHQVIQQPARGRSWRHARSERAPRSMLPSAAPARFVLLVVFLRVRDAQMDGAQAEELATDESVGHQRGPEVEQNNGQYEMLVRRSHQKDVNQRFAIFAPLPGQPRPTRMSRLGLLSESASRRREPTCLSIVLLHLWLLLLLLLS